MEHDQSRNNSSNQIKNMKFTLELLTEDLHKTQTGLDRLRRLLSSPLDLGLKRHSLDVIDNLHALAKRTEDNYQRINSRIDFLSERINELEKAVSESYNSINERFNFWLHDVVNNRSEPVAFLDFSRSMKSSGLTYVYFLNGLVGGNSVLICMPVSAGIERSNFVSNQSLAFSKYVENPRKWLKPLRRLWHKLFKKTNKWVYHLFSSPRKDKTLGTFKGKGDLPQKEYLPFKYDDPNQLLKILYDFINMYGLNGCNCANLITDRKVYALFMSEQPFVMKDHQVEFTRSIPDKEGKQTSEIIVFR